MKRWLSLSLVLISSAVALWAQQPPLDQVIPEVNWEQADVQAVLNWIADEAGLDITISPGVQGFVTLRLRNRTVREILQAVADQVFAEFIVDPKGVINFRPRQQVIAQPTGRDQVRPIRLEAPGFQEGAVWERVGFRFMTAYDGAMLFGGFILLPSQLYMGMGMGGMGGFGGWGGMGGMGGLGGWGGMGGMGGLGGWGGMGGMGGFGGWGGMGGMGGLGGWGGMGGMGGFGGWGGMGGMGGFGGWGGMGGGGFGF